MCKVLLGHKIYFFTDYSTRLHDLAHFFLPAFFPKPIKVHFGQHRPHVSSFWNCVECPGCLFYKDGHLILSRPVLIEPTVNRVPVWIEPTRQDKLYDSTLAATFPFFRSLEKKTISGEIKEKVP